MGVAGLWPVLKPAGVKRSLTNLAVVDGFEANPNGMRGLRVGIDASIWMVHATNWVSSASDGRDKGENPELRTILFKCTRLMQKPFLPFFVFDGPYRPDVKRGKNITKTPHWMISGMQDILTALGVEWRTAPGEAEAELAYLNRIGVIDLVLTDDVDTFLFGAKMLMRNCNNTLSGNRSAPVLNDAGKDDGNHTMTYHADDILEKTGLTHGGLILVALLSGGDYHDGVYGCGPDIGVALARCGFGDSLLDAVRKGKAHLEAFLSGWRTDIREELRTNGHGHLKTKKPTLAKKFPESFPDLAVLDMYVNPVTSETKGKTAAHMNVNWDKEPRIDALAHVCERFFEWGYREAIVKRFRTIIWPYALLRILRRVAILKDRGTACDGLLATVRQYFSQAHTGDAGSVGTTDDGDPLLVKIHMQRRHPETDHLLEYRLEVAPALLVLLTHAGIEDMRGPPDMTGLSDWEDEAEDEDEDGGRKEKTRKPPPDPDSRLRLWLPASMVLAVDSDLVEQYETREAKKAEKKAGHTARDKTPSSPTKKKAPRKKIVAIAEEVEESEDEALAPTLTVPLTLVVEKEIRPKGKAKAKAPVPAPFPMSSTSLEPSGSQSHQQRSRLKGVDDVFKAKKTIHGPAAASSSKVAEVAKLFVPGFDMFKDLTEKPADQPPRLSRPASPTKPSAMSLVLERTLSQASSFTTTPFSSQGSTYASSSSRATSTTMSSYSQTRPHPKPFPMDLDFAWEPDAGPSTVRGRAASPVRRASKPPPAPTRTEKQRRPRTPDSDPRAAKVPLPKSPCTSAARGSPCKSKKGTGTWDSASDDDGPRAVSPSPMRPPKKKAQKEKAAGKQMATVDVICISSDSDGETAPMKKHPPPVCAKSPRKRLPKRVDPREIIEISD